MKRTGDRCHTAADEAPVSFDLRFGHRWIVVATLVILFALGIANFALHRAVLESGHPMLAQLPAGLRAAGGRMSFALEFLLLVAAMLFAADGSIIAAIAYAAYAGLNAFSAWLMLSGRV